MNIDKCNALRALGFRYITRNMNGDVIAWKNEPKRSLTVVEGYEKEAEIEYPDAVIYDVETEKDEECYKYIGGYNIDFCCFSRASYDNQDSSILHISKLDADYADITWKNSPYNLGNSLEVSKEEKFQALKTLGFNYLTRDMDGKCQAWVIKPVRIVTILREFLNDYANKFKDADLRIEEEQDEDDEYVNGYHVYYCSFQCSRGDKGWFYNNYTLDTKDTDFAGILWENEPYEL